MTAGSHAERATCGRETVRARPELPADGGRKSPVRFLSVRIKLMKVSQDNGNLNNVLAQHPAYTRTTENNVLARHKRHLLLFSTITGSLSGSRDIHCDTRWQSAALRQVT